MLVKNCIFVRRFSITFIISQFAVCRSHVNRLDHLFEESGWRGASRGGSRVWQLLQGEGHVDEYPLYAATGRAVRGRDAP